MFHPKSLKQDFLDSELKVGFMKCLFKIKFPYFKLYIILKDKFKQAGDFSENQYFFELFQGNSWWLQSYFSVCKLFSAKWE